MIELANLSVSHKQGYELRTVVHDVNLQVAAGECFGLVGPSGCGKSSLLWVMAGLNPHWRGQMTLANTAVQPGKPFTGQLRRDGLQRQHRGPAKLCQPVDASALPYEPPIDIIS